MPPVPKVTSALPPSLQKAPNDVNNPPTQHGTLGITTRARNKHVHPIVAAGVAPRSRRSSQQVRVEKKALQDFAEQKAARQQAAIEHLAIIEDNQEREETPTKHLLLRKVTRPQAPTSQQPAHEDSPRVSYSDVEYDGT
jgi:hypothetical protein